MITIITTTTILVTIVIITTVVIVKKLFGYSTVIWHSNHSTVIVTIMVTIIITILVTIIATMLVTIVIITSIMINQLLIMTRITRIPIATIIMRLVMINEPSDYHLIVTIYGNEHLMAL